MTGAAVKRHDRAQLLFGMLCFVKKTVANEGVRTLKGALDILPRSPGVYQMYDAGKAFLYIGKAKNIAARVQSYTHPDRLPVRLKRMISCIRSIEIIQTRTEAEALLLEAHLIQKHQPPYNVVFKDNKTLPYLCLSSETWPRLQRLRGNPHQKETVFGPFPSVKEVALTQNALQRAFQLRTCSDHVFASRTRPCLQYDIKRCTAPCVGNISATDYKACVKGVKAVLEGRSLKVQQDMARQMEALSAKRSYEQAAALRDRIKALAAIQQKQALFLKNKKAVDVVAFHSSGGLVCAYFLFFRGGQLLGGKAFMTNRFDKKISQRTPDAAQEAGQEAWISESYPLLLAQFYAKNPRPSLLLLKDMPLDDGVLESALNQKTTQPLCIRAPHNAQENDVFLHAQKNAKEALLRRAFDLQTQEQLLKDLQAFLHLPSLPTRIEVYDNSHLFGTNGYGAMVVAGEDGFEKQNYRLFKVPPALDGQDDYAMMRYVLKRRFAGKSATKDEKGRLDGVKPSLLILDGGKGHMSAARAVMHELGLHDIPLLAIAKGPSRGRLGETFYDQTGTELDLQAPSPIFFYLERLRDEVHRFAIEGHRRQRQKNVMRSPLDAIQGIGPKRKKDLLNAFGSLSGLKEARLEQLMQVKGLSKALATKIYESLQNHD